MNESKVSRQIVSIELQLNGESVQTSAGTITELLEEQGLDSSRPGIAVALNDTVILRAQWNTYPVAEADRVEVITAMQGG